MTAGDFQAFIQVFPSVSKITYIEKRYNYFLKGFTRDYSLQVKGS